MPIRLHLDSVEFFDESTSRIIRVKPLKEYYEFEHSLRAIAKWESRYQKPFLVREPKTKEELQYYCVCMCVNSEEPSIDLMTDSVLHQLIEYMGLNQTATVIENDSTDNTGSFVSSEVIYANMADLNIPFYCDKWNLTRLLALTGVLIDRKSDKKKKMSRSEIYNRNATLNAKRRREMNSRG